MTLYSIQTLRAAAALLVLLYHAASLEGLAIADNPLSVDQGPLFGRLWANGYAGVDLFFVISGFIMVYVTAGGGGTTRSVAGFLFARGARIYPVYWLFTLVMMGYFLVVSGAPVDVARVDQAGIAHDRHILSSLLLAPQPIHPILGVGWTLVHEMHFYLVFALILLAPRRALPWLLGAWAALCAVGAAAGLTSPVAGDAMELLFSPMSLEFILGAGVGLLVVRGWRIAPLALSVLGAFWFAAALAMSWTLDASFLIWGRVLVFAPPCALLVYGLATLEAEGRFRAWGPATAVGDWSYALYLSHVFSIGLIRRVSPAARDALEAAGAPDWAADLLRPGAAGVWDNLVFNLVGLAGALVVAWATHRFFERPTLAAAAWARRRIVADEQQRFRAARLAPSQTW